MHPFIHQFLLYLSVFVFSQCYDGASVMSGKDGGVQKLIQDDLKRKVPYFHCLNHQFHLVVIKAIESVQIVKQFFDQVRYPAIVMLGLLMFHFIQ